PGGRSNAVGRQPTSPPCTPAEILWKRAGPSSARHASRRPSTATNPKAPAVSALAACATVSFSPPTIVTGRRTGTATALINVGPRLTPASNAAANRNSAMNFARTIAAAGTGSGPSTAVSRASSDRASHSATATSAMTIIDTEISRKRSSSATSAVKPGGRKMLNWNLTARKKARNRLDTTISAQVIVSTSRRSASGEIRSGTRNRCRKCRTSSRLPTVHHDVRDVARRPLGIVAQHELSEHLLERILGHERLEIRDRIVGDNAAMVEDDDAIAQLLDQLEDVRAVENRLAALRQRAHEMSQDQRRRDVEARIGLVEDQDVRIFDERCDQQHFLLHPFRI